MEGSSFILSLLQEAIESFEEYKKANVKEIDQLIETVGEDHRRWKAPTASIHKVNWDAAVDTLNGQIVGDDHRRWKAPTAGIHKVNWDVAVDTLNGHMGMGMGSCCGGILRDV